MCTVTYIPAKEKRPFILTSNRDESILREQASQPIVKEIDGLKTLTPIDMKAGGSWIGVSEKGRIACVLNGAFEKHTRTPPYRMSRGLVFLDNFLFEDITVYAHQYNFDGIEPFMLVVAETQQPQSLFELVWDGKNVFSTQREADKPHIWSSSTLYTSEMKQKRIQWFNAVLEKSNSPNADEMLNFHCKGGAHAPPNERIKLEREDGVKTVSTTQVICFASSATMIHLNHLNRKKYKEKLLLT